MRIAVFGSGGVGAYFGGRLAQAGEDVIFIARGEHLQRMRADGLRVDSLKGDFVIDPVQATDDPSTVGEVDAVLVAVKSWQVPEAAESMRPMVGAETFVVPLENGVEAPGQLAAALGKEHVLGGLCKISAFIVEPGYVKHAGLEPYIAFGELDCTRSERAERLRQAFEHAGVRVEFPDDIQAAIWEKFLFIVAASGVGGVTRAPLGATRSLTETRRLLEQVMEEVCAVAKAQGILLAEDVVAKTMAAIDGYQYGVTASMQRDIAGGRPSELEAQNGAVVRMGKELGVPVPVNTFLYAALLPQELRARGKLQF